MSRGEFVDEVVEARALQRDGREDEDIIESDGVRVLDRGVRFLREVARGGDRAGERAQAMGCEEHA